MSSRTVASTIRSGRSSAFAGDSPAPGLLLAWSPPGASPVDRLAIGPGLTIGRSSRADWTIADDRMSSRHFRVRPCGETFLVEDLESTNGTFVDGRPVATEGPSVARAQSVIRAGHALFVIEPDLRRLQVEAVVPPELAGRFHAPVLVESLDVAARTGRHVLLAGESGSGKELCAQWLASACGTGGPVVLHNCAQFASAEEAEASIFGVGRGVFSGVEARRGLLEEAEGGVLFLDEVHLLPARVQASLLRFVEDHRHVRIGGSQRRQLSLRLVLATNVPLDSGQIAADLLARLFVVEVPPLGRRRADVPDVFVHALRRAAASANVDATALLRALEADHLEALCLADLAGRNVRALQALAAELVARASRSREPPERLVPAVFGAHFGHSVVAQRAARASEPTSHYETNRDRIVSAYHAAGGNVSETERALRAEGLTVNRRWLTHFLERWGVRAPRRG